jgi:hypothetical protein
MTSFDSTKSLKRQIDLMLDNELPKEDEAILIKYMENDPRSNKYLEKAKEFRTFIKDNVRRSAVSPSIEQSIRNSIKL